MGSSRNRLRRSTRLPRPERYLSTQQPVYGPRLAEEGKKRAVVLARERRSTRFRREFQSPNPSSCSCWRFYLYTLSCGRRRRFSLLLVLQRTTRKTRKKRRTKKRAREARGRGRERAPPWWRSDPRRRQKEATTPTTTTSRRYPKVGVWLFRVHERGGCLGCLVVSCIRSGSQRGQKRIIAVHQKTGKIVHEA